MLHLLVIWLLPKRSDNKFSLKLIFLQAQCNLQATAAGRHKVLRKSETSLMLINWIVQIDEKAFNYQYVLILLPSQGQGSGIMGRKCVA